ncbi:iron ABC transporter substrate-binding protein [Spirilliplanes yamanashiensis]|uniref:Iron ABC transporter substrate-binding protein n=1 Tax=Spirilliplanes yamanashiensis TaxID=42233 RepID=A0A8J3YBR9_9ACTN|nr:iron ABC transporter substrate-binding protein [Spirilliplanes yamanashiensis]GIJ04987.1 iron ABC transporter substrate-binding protein [Spirilliplanes yamanashiensis]
MPVSPSRLRPAVAAALGGALLFALAACGGGEPASEPDDKTIVLYSGRNETLVKPLLDKFSQQTGIAVQARYGTTAQMAAQLAEEGDRSPAEVFLAQDAGALGAVNKKGMFAALPAEATAKVPAIYRAEDGNWVGVTARSRVLVYNPALVKAADLPASVFDLTGPAWKGKVAVAPTNGSFQAFVTAVRVQHGEQKAKEFFTALKANDAQIRANNIEIVTDVDAGKVPAGLVNHYYLGEIAKERGVTPEQLNAKLHFFTPGDSGAMVNVSGVGVLKRSATDPDARALVDYLLGAEAQTYFAEETFEYPVVAGAPAPAYVPALADLKAPAIDLNDLETLEASIALIKESGLTP